MLFAVTDPCTRTEANWPMVVMTLILALVGLAIFAIYRFTNIERLKIMMDEDRRYDPSTALPKFDVSTFQSKDDQ